MEHVRNDEYYYSIGSETVMTPIENFLLYLVAAFFFVVGVSLTILSSAVVLQPSWLMKIASVGFAIAVVIAAVFFLVLVWK